MSGKWSQGGVPHKGWSCINIEDLGAPDAICEMCETQEIRYVHYMEHPHYTEVLGVGCICAGHMEEDYEGARRRELDLKNAAQRRRRWLNRKWKISNNGNPYLNTDGFNIVVFPKADGSWGGRIEDRVTGRSVKSRRHYTSEDQTKLAAFDAMIFLKNRRAWGRRL